MGSNVWFAVLAVMGILLPSLAWAEKPGLADALAQTPLAQIFPEADRLGPVEGDPPAAAVYANDKQLGYVFLNTDVMPANGYSGKPIQILIGVDGQGRVVGARLVKHSEPIVLIGIPQAKIEKFIDSYKGRGSGEFVEPGQKGGPDVVGGATVTVMVIGDSITRSVGVIARSRGLGGAKAEAAAAESRSVNRTAEGSQSWEQLLGDGSIRRLRLTVGTVNKAMAEADPRAAAVPEPEPDDDDFIDLYVASLDAPVIGRSLLGEREYQRLAGQLGDKGSAILVMANGRYSFRGSGYVRGGIFDRITLVQDTATIRFRDRNYERLGDVAAEGAPRFAEIGLFTLPPNSGFDPARPWRFQLLVQRAVGALDKVYRSFDLGYELPAKWLTQPQPVPKPQAAAPAQPAPEAAAGPGQPSPQPLWQRMWLAKSGQIAVLVVALVILTLIFFFQDWLVRRPRLTRWLRLSFLTFTLVWIGWYANAQLSVVNILALSNALVTGFSWDYFLVDPLLFILWCAVAASLLFWGRGAFCGWLCPFGALQEFASLGAKKLRIPQIQVPWAVHERIWPVKYIIFLGLFGFGIYSLAFSEHLAEVEPFKTAIVLKFLRNWPFVLYALLLLAAGLFIERFFCRYLCPLGAALAIPARLRMFEWLKRYRECGNPCQRCANECPVQSIHPEGRINPNECIYCLHCQTLYWDEHRCPVMIQKRLKRERRATMSAPPNIQSLKQGGDDHGRPGEG